MKALVVGGTFDHEQGKPSKIVQAMADNLGWDVMNGGSLDDLRGVDFTAVDTLLWMPNIDNAEAKILPDIKAANPKLTLISSKRVVEKDYTEFDVIGRMLKSKSNLGIMITKDNDTYRFRLMDPLGNLYADTHEISDLAEAMNERVAEIKSMTRAPSKKIGEALPLEVEQEFLDRILKLGDIFSRHVNAVNPDRFLGNASTRMGLEFGEVTRSTRCCHGFPSQRIGDKLLISRRNVDKQNMSVRDFVAVENRLGEGVEYYGDVKPSVDTPIQIKLFEKYPNVNYIIHGHTYVDGAPETKSKVPCGHLEEFDEIEELFPDADSTNFVVNLKGHGCLILAEDETYFDSVDFVSRPFPEP